jgi:hypothetical protein
MTCTAASRSFLDDACAVAAFVDLAETLAVSPSVLISDAYPLVGIVVNQKSAPPPE